QLHSFPTRRSSDLARAQRFCICQPIDESCSGCNKIRKPTWDTRAFHNMRITRVYLVLSFGKLFYHYSVKNREIFSGPTGEQALVIYDIASFSISSSIE